MIYFTMATHSIVISMLFTFGSVVLGASRVYEPDLEEVSAEAELIVEGEAVRILDIPVTTGVRYQFATFQLMEMYKGDLIPLSAVDLKGRLTEGRFLNVIVQVESYSSGRLPPDYRIGERYILFLQCATQFVYARTPKEDVWVERQASDELKASLRKILRPGKTDEHAN